MGTVINLRQARKQRDRKAKEAQAETNRALHGRTKAERKRTEAEDALATRRLDGHARQTPPAGVDDGSGDGVDGEGI